MAAAAIKVEKYAIALEACEAALTKDPDDAKALYRKGVCLWKRGRLSAAEKVCARDTCFSPVPASFASGRRGHQRKQRSSV